MPKDINDFRRDRKAAADDMEAAVGLIEDAEEAQTDEEAAVGGSDDLKSANADFDKAEAAFHAADAQVKRLESVEAAKAAAAVSEQDPTSAPAAGSGISATPENPNHKGLQAAFMFQALAVNGGDRDKACAFLEDAGHSGISASLSGATPAAGGVTVPTPLAGELIELLLPRVTVRASGARSVDMPAGEIRNARMGSGATAAYGTENSAIAESEPTFDNVDQKFKKLGCLVPVGNSLLRHTSVSMAIEVRDIILKKMGLREDLAFLRGDGLSNDPVGLKNWMLAANWQAGVGNTAAVVEAALRGTVSKVEDADVGMIRCGWIMRASAKNFLASLREPVGGAYLFPALRGNNPELLGYPVRVTSQIPDNLGAGGNETEVYFADFDEVMIGDAMDVTFATSTEAAYVDAGGTTRSAFQDDLTLMRAISEHDLAPRHDAALAGLTGANWTL